MEEVAAAAEEAADDQRGVARSVRKMARLRERGWTWARILDEQVGPSPLEVLRRSTRRVSRATSGLARALAVGLIAEGLSVRAAAVRLGVSHQRVFKMLGPIGRSHRGET